MISINNKRWDKLRSTDVEKLLASDVDENFFYEFKADDETTAKLMKEISALSNTYGGYILLGVNNDKTIGGCQKWTEQRIHTTIHDSITPIPNFDVKKFKIHGKIVLIIKIEEGSFPKNDEAAMKYGFNDFLPSHQIKYGNNLIVEGDRFPKNDYFLIDRRYFSDCKVKYNMEQLMFELFRSVYYNLGFIDPLKEIDDIE